MSACTSGSCERHKSAALTVTEDSSFMGLVKAAWIVIMSIVLRDRDRGLSRIILEAVSKPLRKGDEHFLFRGLRKMSQSPAVSKPLLVLFFVPAASEGAATPPPIETASLGNILWVTPS
jgi:hypothetical protein